jgi:hypothetical protein
MVDHVTLEAIVLALTIVGVATTAGVLSMAIADCAVLKDRGLNGARSRIAYANVRRKVVRLVILNIIGISTLIVASSEIALLMGALSMLLTADAAGDWYDRRYLTKFLRGKQDEAGNDIVQPAGPQPTPDHPADGPRAETPAV